MKIKYRNSIAAMMMVLILFSTIGFTIISTFCEGCEMEHTSLAMIEVEDDMNCECCSVEEHVSCCTSSDDQESPKKEGKLAQLKFDSPEARSKIFQLEQPVFLIHFVSVLLNNEFIAVLTESFVLKFQAPPLGGRQLLSLNCTLLC